jgi:uncharacterized lipoprotein YajG
MRIGLSLVLMFLLAGCATDTSAVTGTDTSSVTGDERGGKLSYAEGKVQVAVKVPQAYCAKFRKRGRIIRMVPASEGGEIGFECH